MKSFYILRHQTVHYPTVNGNADLELLLTPQCRVRNFSYEFAVLSKNKILRDFWETQSLKNGLNRRFWKKIASLWLRHLRFESLYLCHHLGTFVFRGFFMPEYCFLRRYSSKVSAFFAKFLLYFSRCTRSELLCRCHSFRLKSQDFSGLCSRRYIRAFPTICRCQQQTIPHRLRRKIQAYRIWKSLCSTAFATLFSKMCFRADEIVPLGLQLNLKIA